MTWTNEQILKLAPDTSASQAARGLAHARNWSSLGASDQALWGLCKGSGEKPYQTQIFLAEPAFKCSCPSRKFPCKHGLALFLLHAADAPSFRDADPPAWVREWLASRASRAEKKESKKTETESPKDPEAQAKSREKTAARRQQRVAEGVEELATWLEDLIRVGLAQPRDESFYRNAASRMVDAQANGLARFVRELGVIPTSGAGWESRLLDAAARLFLLIEGFRRLDRLPPDVQEDVRSLIGWVQEQQEVKQQEPVTDRWIVLGQRTEFDERLQVQRTWLFGERTRRRPLLLAFSYGNQAPFSGLTAGTSFEGNLVFFPGRLGQRAAIKERLGAAMAVEVLPGSSIGDEIARWGETLATHPWLTQFPVVLSGVTPARDGQRWRLIDEERKGIEMHPRFSKTWQVAALSGGRPVSVFGEWTGDFLWPLTVAAEGRLIDLG